MTLWPWVIKNQTKHKNHRDFWGHLVVTTASNDPVTFLGHELGQIDDRGQRDLLGPKKGHGEL